MRYNLHGKIFNSTLGSATMDIEPGEWKAERKRQGLTQQQLAARSGVGLNFVYQLEKNKASVQLDSVNQVLRALGYQISVARDFRPWDADSSPVRVGASLAADIDDESFVDP
jgi:y4mF family transcriptional regulator